MLNNNFIVFLNSHNFNKIKFIRNLPILLILIFFINFYNYQIKFHVKISYLISYISFF